MAEQKQSYTYHTVTAASAAASWQEQRLVPWDGNRPLSETRAARIAAHVESSRDFGPVPIVIGIVRHGARAGEYVIDGQHRLRAATLLSPAVADRARLCLCKCDCADDGDLRRIFVAVNCGAPVPASYWDADVAAFILGVATAAGRRWSNIVDYEKCPPRPRIEYARLRSEIDTHQATREAVAARTLSTADAVAQLDIMNSTIRMSIADASKARRLAKAKAMFEGVTQLTLDRADATACYLGLDRHWPTTLMDGLGRKWRAADNDD